MGDGVGELAPDLVGALGDGGESAGAAGRAGSAGRAVSYGSATVSERVRARSPHILDPQTLARHVDGLYRAAWALCGSREDAEDLVQETFARVLARPRVIRGEELWYLVRVLRNAFLNSRRDAARRPVAGPSLQECEPVDLNGRTQPEQALEAQELYAAIATLPQDFRLAIVAIDMLGLSYGEAARALGTRESTVTTRLFRARRAVVRELEGQPRNKLGDSARGVKDGMAEPEERRVV